MTTVHHVSSMQLQSALAAGEARTSIAQALNKLNTAHAQLVLAEFVGQYFPQGHAPAQAQAPAPVKRGRKPGRKAKAAAKPVAKLKKQVRRGRKPAVSGAVTEGSKTQVLLGALETKPGADIGVLCEAVYGKDDAEVRGKLRSLLGALTRRGLVKKTGRGSWEATGTQSSGQDAASVNGASEIPTPAVSEPAPFPASA